MNPITAKTPVGAIASRFPGAAGVFMRYDLDFCCNGRVALADACAGRGLDPGAIADEILQSAVTDEDASAWEDRPLDELIDHIIDVYHVPLRSELNGLSMMVRKVNRVHGEKDSRLAELERVVVALRVELLDHMEKEEQVLFPWIRAGNGASAGGPVRVMLLEHEAAGDALAKIRELTDRFTPPNGACTTWRAMLIGLEWLDGSLRRHIHLENNILFPRALAGG